MSDYTSQWEWKRFDDWEPFHIGRAQFDQFTLREILQLVEYDSMFSLFNKEVLVVGERVFVTHQATLFRGRPAVQKMLHLRRIQKVLVEE